MANAKLSAKRGVCSLVSVQVMKTSVKFAVKKGGICRPYRNNDTGVTFDINDGRSCQREEVQGSCVQVL